MARLHVALIPLLLLFAAVPAAAVDPTGNDAGSGRDAGDVRHLAIPVSEGRVEGTLRALVDEVDLYTFSASRGQLLSVDIPAETCNDGGWWIQAQGPEGEFAGIFARSGRVVLDTTGTHTLHVQLLSAAPAQTCAYAFDWSLRDGAIDLGNEVAEIAWENASEVLIQVGRLATTGLGASISVDTIDLTFEVDDGPRFGWGWLAVWEGSGLSPTVRTRETPHDIDASPFIETVTLGSYAGMSILSANGMNLSGTARLLGFASSTTASHMWAWADVPLDARVSSVGEITRWNAYDDATLTTPAASHAPARTRTIDLGPTFVGVFSPDGPSTVTPPDAPTRAPEYYGSEFLFFETPGPWRFDIAEQTRTENTGDIHLFGAAPPPLGLHTSLFR